MFLIFLISFTITFIFTSIYITIFLLLKFIRVLKFFSVVFFPFSINLDIFLHFNHKKLFKKILRYSRDDRFISNSELFISNIVHRFLKFLKPKENFQSCQIVGKNDFREANHWWPLTDRRVDTVHDRYSRVSWDSACQFLPLVKIEDVARSGFEYFEKWKVSLWSHKFISKIGYR